MVRGFTLIEVMLVMLIIGVLATSLSLSLAPDSHRQIQAEAYRLANVLEQAVDVAEMGLPLGLVWEPGGYAFQRLLPDGRWVVERNDPFRARRWPDGIEAGAAPQNSASMPWMLWRENQSPALRLSLFSASRQLELHLSPLGRVTVQETAR